MAAIYKYTCHNPRCPWFVRSSNEFTFNAVPKIQDGSSENHFHCPHCQTGTDGYLEAVALKRVNIGEMSAKARGWGKRLAPKLTGGTRQILPLPEKGQRVQSADVISSDNRTYRPEIPGFREVDGKEARG